MGSRPVEYVPGVDVVVACDVVLHDVGTVGTVLGRCTDEIWSRTSSYIVLLDGECEVCALAQRCLLGPQMVYLC